MKGLDDLEIVQVECGGMHTVALANDGKVNMTTKLVTHDFHCFCCQVKFTMINNDKLLCLS